MRWNTVLFDLDGTVTDPKEGITCAVAYALRQQGIIADPDTLTPFIGPPLHESFPELFGLTEEQTDRAVEDFRVYFSRQGWAENIPYEGMAEFLESLQKAGLKLVIATSKPEEFARRIMEHFDLARRTLLVRKDELCIYFFRTVYLQSLQPEQIIANL